MSAVTRLLAQRPKQLRVLAGSGQLGYGIPEAAFRAGVERQPHFIGCDMGSIDPGPAYLGSGEMATSPEVTRRDLALVLGAARQLDVPLLIGTAGTAGAGPHLEATLTMIRDIAREQSLHFRMATIRADVAPERVVRALEQGELKALGAPLSVTADDIRACTQLVGQMGCAPFRQALEHDPDVIVAGRSCDTAVFAAIPQRLGFSMADVMHMAKIIECGSVCCVPGGRDSILGTIDETGFELESMNPDRRATPLSIAAHSLYEQANPLSFTEPDGTLDVTAARYHAIDDRRTRVAGAIWRPAARTTIKIEGSAPVGYRTVLLAGSADPGFIAHLPVALREVEINTRKVLPGDYRFLPRIYGVDGVMAWRTPPAAPPREVFVLVEVVSETAEQGLAAAKTFKQFLLHHGFSGRYCTSGNLAFPLTPPELPAGRAYRFPLYHVMPVDADEQLFPVAIEQI
ncbi:MAG: acyclic terpene utilization AtuA family protein [Lautropia sp.]